MKLTVLGCGDAFASEGRYNTSFLLEEEGEKVLIDCGATTLVRLRQLRVNIGEINTIIISHFHGDHYGGLPFLMLTNHAKYDRKHPLTIIGPEGIRGKAHQLQEALYPGTSRVIDELGVQYLAYQAKETLNHDGMAIYPREVTHAPPSNPHGIRLSWKEKAFAFSGDTEWNDSLIDLATGTDLFIVECNNYLTDSPGHLSYKTIMDRKADFKTKRLMLTHMGSEVINEPNLEVDRLTDGMEVYF